MSTISRDSIAPQADVLSRVITGNQLEINVLLHLKLLFFLSPTWIKDHVVNYKDLMSLVQLTHRAGPSVRLIVCKRVSDQVSCTYHHQLHHTPKITMEANKHCWSWYIFVKCSFCCLSYPLSSFLFIYQLLIFYTHTHTRGTRNLSSGRGKKLKLSSHPLCYY